MTLANNIFADLIPVSPTGFTERQEGFSSTAYPDLIAGTPVIGYGTLLDERRRPGVRQQLAGIGYDFDALASGRQAITPEDAARIKQASMADYERLVDRTFGPVQGPKRQALVDMAYQGWNKWFTPELVAAVKSGDDATASALIRASYPNAQGLPGLQARAEQRAAMFAGSGATTINEPLATAGAGAQDQNLFADLIPDKPKIESGNLFADLVPTKKESSGIGTAFLSGLETTADALAAVAASMGVDREGAAKSIAETGFGSRYEPPEVIKTFGDQFDKGEYLKAAGTLLANPLTILGHVTAQGLGTSVLPMATGLGGVAAGAPLGPLGAIGGGAAGLGAGSAMIEYGATILETLADKKVDMTDSVAIGKAFDDPKIMEEARDRAIKRGIAVGAFDAATGLLAGRILQFAKPTVRSIAGRGAAEVGIQMAGGAAGEAAGQLATEGQIKKPSDVAFEALGEIIPGVGEAVVGARIRRAGKPDVEHPPPPGDTAPPPSPESLPPVGETIGLTQRDGPPMRGIVESYSDDGRYAFVRDETGDLEPMLSAELLRDLTTAPPAREIEPAGTRPEAIPQEEMESIQDEYQRWIDAQPPPPPAPRPVAPTPLLDQAEPINRAPAEIPTAALPAAEAAREQARLAPLGQAPVAAPNLGKTPIPIAPEVSPTAVVQPPAAVLAPSSRDFNFPVEPKVWPTTAQAAESVAPVAGVEQRVLDHIQTGKAKLTPEAIGKALGIEPGAASAALQSIAARKDSPIFQVKGKTTKVLDAKGKPTGVVKQSARAGTYAYVPRRGELDVFEALAKEGGIKDVGGDLKAVLDSNPFVPGFGRLVRQNSPDAKTPDYVREFLVERKYLPEGASLDDVSELLDRRLREGKKIFPQGEQSAAQERSAAEAEMDETAFKWGVNLVGLGPKAAQAAMAKAQAERADLMARAAQRGVDVNEDMENDELLAAVIEREAIQDIDGVAVEADIDRYADPLPLDTREDFDRGLQSEAGPGPAAPEYAQAGQQESGLVATPEANRGGPDQAADRGEQVARPEGGQAGIGEQPLLPPTGPEGSPAEAEAARQQEINRLEAEQSKLRSRKEQKSARDQEGGLFSAERDQGSLLPYRPKVVRRDKSGRPIERAPMPTEGQTDALQDAIEERIKERDQHEAEALDAATKGPNGPDAWITDLANASRGPGGENLRELSKIGLYTAFPRGLAALDAVFSRYWHAHEAADAMRHRLEVEFAEGLRGSSLNNLSEADKKQLEAVQELDRIAGNNRRDTGRRIVARNVDTQAELSKPGETIALSEAATKAYFTDRETFRKGWDHIIQAVLRKMGWDGEPTAKAIKEALKDAEGREAKHLARVLEIHDLLEQQRRTGYVPLMRYGNQYVLVTRNEDGSTARFELVDTKRPLDSIFGRSVKADEEHESVAKRVAELRKQFPIDKFNIHSGTVNPKVWERIDIPALEKLASAITQDDKATYEGVMEGFMSKLHEEMKAGFRKKSQNIPGYSTDFERAKADYFRHLAAVVSRMYYSREIDNTFEATQKHRNQNVRQYAKNFKDRMDSSKSDYAALRKYGFFMFLAGSPASAIVNLTQTPLVSALNLGAWAGQLRAQGLLTSALNESRQGLRIGDRGLTVDYSRIGKTEAERAMIDRFAKDGTLSAQLTQELRGGNITESRALRPAARGVGKTFDILASGFGSAEIVNRVTMALAAFRAANNPALREKANKVYKDNEAFQELKRRNGGIQAEWLAKFMVDETQFKSGEINRPPIATGPGAALLQFKTFQMNYIRNLAQLMTRMGPEGKFAAFLMLAALVAVSGLKGFPFAEDALGLAEWSIKLATGIDRDFDRMLRQIMIKNEFSAYAAEMMLQGPSRQLLGVDMGKRLGQGDLIPRLELMDALGVPAAGTLGKAAEVVTRYQHDQPLGAIAAALPKFAGDIMKGAIVMPEEGSQTMKGRPVKLPSEIGPMERVGKALGFTSADQARRTESDWGQYRIANAPKEARSALYTNLATQATLAEDARQSGDYEKAKRHEAQFQSLWDRNNATLASEIPDYQKIVLDPKSLQKRIRQFANPESARIKNAPKTTREELLRNPYVGRGP